ncbi:MAG TPA: acyltransferase family protein [Steroidobacteraceae bacterium]|nr:acyltransferase family protein [Steroidobacteraceae bacterium]
MTEKRAYLHEIDAVRGLLMALGIVLHAANPYAPNQHWLLLDAQKSLMLGQLADLVHLFRMPAFFIIAGFFSAIGLSRSPRAAYLRKRAVRLVLPLLVALVVFNVPQNVFLAWWQQTRCPASDGSCAVNLVPGAWISHLWFLVYLVGYTLLLAAFWGLVARLLDAIRLARRPPGPAAIVILTIASTAVAGVAIAAAARAMPILYIDIAGFLTPSKFLFYGAFFAVGVATAARGFDRDCLMFPSRRRWAAAGVAALVLVAVGTLSPDGTGLVARIAAVFTESAWRAVSALVAIWLLVYLFRDPNPACRRLADASYTVYLLHHVCIIVIGAFLTTVDLPAAVKFLCNVTVTLAICLVVHDRLVAPHRYVRLALNGA